jgi:hypothetical protein
MPILYLNSVCIESTTDRIQGLIKITNKKYAIFICTCPYYYYTEGKLHVGDTGVDSNIMNLSAAQQDV